MKELDILLEAFIERRREALAAGEMPELEEFLGQEDDLIWSWLQNTSDPPDPRFRALAVSIRGGK